MSKKVTLGGERLGSGKKMKVELHGYERSTHDMGYLFRTTMSVGTLIPFLVEVGLPGDTFDINLNCEMLTHPTIGPLFGTQKVQLDVFQAPVRLYQGQLHNNKLGIGMNMANVKLPLMTLLATPESVPPVVDMDNTQINPSCLLSYLNIRGVGRVSDAIPDGVPRDFNALSLLMYWDVYKNYYSNKMETDGAMIAGRNLIIVDSVDQITAGTPPSDDIIGTDPVFITTDEQIIITWTGTEPLTWQIIFVTDRGEWPGDVVLTPNTGGGDYSWKHSITGDVNVYSWRYITANEMPNKAIEVHRFPLSTIDNMREEILSETMVGGAFKLNDHWLDGDPYERLLNWTPAAENSTYLLSQQGLGLKTYQSDLLNNWLSTEWIDGAQGINEITKVDTTDGGFTMDVLLLNKKVYDMLNRIAVSGGSYNDWQAAVYDVEAYGQAESPIYHGGLIKELIFQEVISNSESGGTDGTQPLGTIAGRGKMSSKHKGGKISFKVNEISYIMGIISVTPRIDYSQGNKWDVHLLTMDDFHKPALDQIGFQELTTEQMAWFDTDWQTTPTPRWVQKSAGKQPAWINYMTNVNQTRGNFAIRDNEMFMTLNRRFDYENQAIADITTYIDPEKFNYIYAETALDSQNIWAQIAVDMEVRRKMSAKLMPNL